MEARLVVLLATGLSKAGAIRDMVEGPVSAWCPASALQMHPSTVVIVDEEAASELTHPDFFKHIEQQNQALLAKIEKNHLKDGATKTEKKIGQSTISIFKMPEQLKGEGSLVDAGVTGAVLEL